MSLLVVDIDDENSIANRRNHIVDAHALRLNVTVTVTVTDLQLCYKSVHLSKSIYLDSGVTPCSCLFPHLVFCETRMAAP
jgi:hypothetical protein